MAQAPSDGAPKQRPTKIRVAFDFGASRGKVYISEFGKNPDEFIAYPLGFPTGGSTLTEFDTTVIFLRGKFDLAYRTSLSHSGARFFRGIKQALLKQEPYASILAEECKVPEDGTPQITFAGLFQTVFTHVYDRVREHLNQQYDFWFDDIECVLTYPVSRSESLQILLLQEARAAGFKVTRSVSEPMAAAYGCKRTLTSHEVSRDNAVLYVDVGAATTDVTVIQLNADGQIVQACPSDGLPHGGDFVNQKTREYLQDNYPKWKALFDDEEWTSQISPHVDDCKRGYGFDDSDQKIRYGERTVHIPPRQMKSFFKPLLDDIVKVVHRSCQRARDAGLCVSTIVVCGGGGAGNDQVFKDLSEQLEQKTGIKLIERKNDTTLVVSGALKYACDPVAEILVIPRDLAVGYDGDYDGRGKPLKHRKRRKMNKGLAWLPCKGKVLEAVSLPYEKDIDPWSTDEGDHFIVTPVYVTADTSDTFSKQIAGPNRFITWPYNITYPVTAKILGQLTELGSFSGKIDHRKIFPPGSEMKEKLVKFHLTIEPAGEYNPILMGRFEVLLPDGSLCPLEGVRYTVLPLVSRSQFMNEQNRSDQGYELRVSSEELQPTTEQESLVSTESPNLPTLSSLESVVTGTRAESGPANTLRLSRERSPVSVVRRPLSSGNNLPVFSAGSSSPTLPPQRAIRTRSIPPRFSPYNPRTPIPNVDFKAATDSRRRRKAMDGQRGGHPYPPQLRVAT